MTVAVAFLLVAACVAAARPARAAEALGASAGTSAFDMCGGDCNHDFHVSVSELIQAVNIALERAPAQNCTAVDADADGRVTVGEIVRAVGNALAVCPCPFDFASNSLQAGVACVYEGRWSDTCGDGSLQATFAGDGATVGVALIADGAADPLTFLSIVRAPGEASLVGYTIGEASQMLPGEVTLAADHRDLAIAPAEAPDLLLRGCPFTGYAGRLVDVVDLR